MAGFSLTWLTAVVFCGLVVYTTNVPTNKRTPAVAWITGLLVFSHIFTQSYLFKVDATSTASAETRQAAEDALQNFQSFLATMAMRPGRLLDYPLFGWYRLVSSSILHYGWLHLLYNVWFFVLFAHVLEFTLGAKKLLMIVAAGLLVPSLLDGLLPGKEPLTGMRYTGGMSGVVYSVIGAYLMIFPRSRCYCAVVYDLKFWGAIFCLLLPVTMVTRFAGLALTETVLIMGAVAAFLLIQPEHARVSVPVYGVVLGKLLQDALLIQPAIDGVLSNNLWRVGGGLFVGAGLGFVYNGKRGWLTHWDDTTKALPPKSNGKARMSVAKLESEGHKSEEGARVYLGQRVFVGDADRAVSFYREVVLQKFPDLLLPLQEQIALARLLHFKGLEKEALHAYETLVKSNPVLPDEFWVAWLKAAELTLKVTPENTARARQYLDRFEQGHGLMMRDKVEAQRLRAELPVVQMDIPEAKTAAHNDFIPESQTSYSESVTGQPLRANMKPHTDEVDCEQDGVPDAVPKVRPRSFLYVPGGSPVSLRQPRERLEAESLADAAYLRTHWKPLPSMAEKKAAEQPALDRRVKNPRLADHNDEEPTLYGGTRESGRSLRNKGRLSQLELRDAALQIEPVKAADMPGQYGGLGDFKDEGVLPRLRLRNEVESPDQSRRRPRMRGVESEKEQQWLKRLEPVAVQVPAADEVVPYGEMDPPSHKFTAAGKTLAVMMVKPDQAHLATELRKLLPDLAERFGTNDFSEICATGFCPAFIFRRLPVTFKDSILEAAAKLNLEVMIIPEDHALLSLEPVEVVSISAENSSCQFKTAYGSRRVAWEEVKLVVLCKMRLTLNSRALHRLIMEIIVEGAQASRFQMFERTLRVPASSVMSKSSDSAEELFNAILSLGQRQACKAIRVPSETGGNLPVFDSYSMYEDYVMQELLIGKRELEQ